MRKWSMLRLLTLLLTLTAGLVRSRRDLLLENLALRQQLAAFTQKQPRPRQVGSGLLGSAASMLGRMERCTCCRAARDRHRLASRRVQAVLEMVVTQTSRCGKEAHVSKAAGADLSQGGRESHLGCAAYPRRVEDARVGDFRAHSAALDAKGPSRYRAGKTMGDVPQQLPRCDRRHGLLHCADAQARRAVLLFRDRSSSASHSSLQRHTASDH